MGKAKQRGARQAAAASVSAEEQAVRAAYAALPDTLAALSPFTLYKSMGMQLHFGAGDKLPAAQMAWVMATLKRCARAQRWRACASASRQNRGLDKNRTANGGADCPYRAA
jgi:hypothetical protein